MGQLWLYLQKVGKSCTANINTVKLTYVGYLWTSQRSLTYLTSDLCVSRVWSDFEEKRWDGDRLMAATLLYTALFNESSCQLLYDAVVFVHFPIGLVINSFRGEDGINYYHLEGGGMKIVEQFKDEQWHNSYPLV